MIVARRRVKISWFQEGILNLRPLKRLWGALKSEQKERLVSWVSNLVPMAFSLRKWEGEKRPWRWPVDSFF